VENLSAGGLFLRTDQQLPKGTPLELDLVKPGGRKALHVVAVVAGVITPEQAASNRFIPGIGVQFVEVGNEEAERLESLLTALGVEPVQAAIPQELRPKVSGRASGPPPAPAPAVTPTKVLPVEQIGPTWTPPPPAARSAAAAPASSWASVAPRPQVSPDRPPTAPVVPKRAEAEAILREIHGELELQDAPLATARPALPPQPPEPPSRPDLPEASKLMTQIRGLIFEMGEMQARLKARDAEILDLRAQLDDARAQIEELETKGV
jgi:uncharacterized protein (TIGR02266 family)